MRTFCLIAHALPLDTDPLPEPMVVATIIADARVTKNLDPHHLLKNLAGKLGLLDYEITSAHAQPLPGHQLHLPLAF